MAERPADRACAAASALTTPATPKPPRCARRWAACSPTSWLPTSWLTDARTLLEASADACERILGLDHPDTLLSRNNLAGAYQDADRLTDALPLLETTLATRERVLGPDHPDTLASRNNLAVAYQDAGQLTDGPPALRGHPQHLRTRPRPRPPRYPDERNNLAQARSAKPGDPGS